MKKCYTLLFLACLSIASLWGADLHNPKLHVCTVANYEHPNLNVLRKSAAKFGLKLQVAGMNQRYRNNFYKLFRMKEHLKKIPDTDIILFVDAFDVVLAGNEKQFVERFRTFNSPVVFSAERYLYPQHSVHDMKIEYPFSPTTFRHLNSGGYIGYAGYIKMMIDDIIAKRFSIPINRYRRLQSDQFHCHRFFLRNLGQVKLDVTNKIFVTLSDVDRNELVVDKENLDFKVLETDNHPIAIHFNGNSKGFYDEIAILFQ